MTSALDKKLNDLFGGKVVRKDLTKLVKGNAIVPTYVLEYLLGQYCATDDEATMEAGVESVRNILARHFVHRDEANIIKATIRERGSHRIIDKISVRLNERKDQYEATFTNLGLKGVLIDDDLVRKHQKLLSEGVWCIVEMSYLSGDERDRVPWVVESLKPIQINNIDLEEYKETRRSFTRDEWMDALLQTMGLNPLEFTFRSKLLQLTRLVPFAENNYNLIELGPKGTGKSHLYSELSPHGILLSGGEVTKAKLFVNNASGDIGLVGYWDVIAYDEFAGRTKRVDRGLVDIMKNYMANKSFSRGSSVHGASASMVFVGNTDHSVPHMLRYSDLFDALPREYHDTAFLDRLHAYLPGWEVQKLRNEMFTDGYGFIVDYLAEVLKEMRKEDRMQVYRDYVELSDTITTRDRDGIAKTVSGLVKVIYPHGEYTEAELLELLDFAIECRMRVKQQLIKMDETFEEVDFSYRLKGSGEVRHIETLEIREHLRASASREQDTEDPSNGSFADDWKKVPREGHLEIMDNQTGICYEDLFGIYLEGVSEVVVTDPYIRMPYQMKNFMEFIRVLDDHKAEGAEVKVRLVTWNEPEHQAQSCEAFEQMALSLAPAGIFLDVNFDETIHDRSIVTDTGWKIVLGRGLDIFQKTGGWYDLSEYDQRQRRCKQAMVMYIRN